MNGLDQALEGSFNQMAALKTDLENVEELLDDKPLDQENIIGSIEQRERQVEEL